MHKSERAVKDDLEDKSLKRDSVIIEIKYFHFKIILFMMTWSIKINV